MAIQLTLKQVSEIIENMSPKMKHEQKHGCSCNKLRNATQFQLEQKRIENCSNTYSEQDL